MLLDLNITAVEEVTRRLLVFEQRHAKLKPPTYSMGWLLLLEKDWLAWQKARRDQEGSNSGSSSSNRGKRRGRGRGRSGGTATTRDGLGSNSNQPSPGGPCRNYANSEAPI